MPFWQNWKNNTNNPYALWKFFIFNGNRSKIFFIFFIPAKNPNRERVIIQTVIDVEDEQLEFQKIGHKELQEKFQDAHEKELGRIIKSLFGLTKSQVACFLKLRSMGTEGTCVQNLVTQTSSERSVEQKKLKHLLNRGLVTREQLKLAAFEKRCSQNQRDDLSPGTTKGYLFIYSAISDQALLEKITGIMDGWQEFLKNLIQQQPQTEELSKQK